MNALLFNAPSDNSLFVSRQMPLGILYIASYLRSKHISMAVKDLNLFSNWRYVLIKSIKAYNPSVIGISSNCTNIQETLEIAAITKRINPKISVVVGGPHPTIAPNTYNNKNIDFIVKGEGEITFYELLTKQDKSKILGLYIQNKNKLDFTGERPLIKDLDSLPFPALDLVNLKKYYINSYKKLPISSIMTSRGCPQQCIFCNQGVFGRKWRFRSPENVVDEIKYHIKLGIREFSIEDDNFTLDIRRVREICSLIIKNKINIPWQLANGIRVDNLDYETLKLMKKAGCWKLAVAPEVGNKEILKKIKKNTDLNKILKVREWCRKLGIVTYGFFMMGFPFETEKNMKNTLDFALKLDPTIMDLTKVVCFPGTELEKYMPCQNSNHVYYEKNINNKLDKIYRRAYLKFYLRPIKILQIISEIGFNNFLKLTKYAFTLLR